MGKEKTYRIGITCRNCGYTLTEPGLSSENMGHLVLIWVHIPESTSVADFLLKKKCTNCGCKGFLEKSK